MPSLPPAPPTRTQPLRSIGYVSTATQLLDAAQLQELLVLSRTANAARGITGVLLHCRGNFMQVLEGPAETLGLTYARILASAAHHSAMELFDEPIAAREFADWSMACREVSASDFDRLRLAPGCTHRALLAQFWRLNT